MNNPLTQRESFTGWRNSELIVEHFDLECSDDDLDYDWVETIQIDEVSKNDAWNSYTTEWKYQLQDLHREWGYSKETTTHYMSIKPDLSSNLKPVLEKFKDKKLNYNLLKLTPGHMLAWHFDSYATFIKTNPISCDEADNIKRTAILLTDWNFGQVIQIGNRVFSDWQKGDAYTWVGDTWHGACNFGNKDLVVMQVTYV
jgi:hypothetical protein